MFTHTLRNLTGAAALLACTLASTLAPSTASAAGATFSDLVIFGDSLSDTGNLSLATGGAEPGIAQPYFNGRYSNGLLWTELLATGLGQTGDANPYLLGGNNYAYAGARTGTGAAPPGLLLQTSTLWGSTHAAADPNALYVLVGGGNDMRDARSLFGSNSAGDQAGRELSAEAAIYKMTTSLGLLASRGAKNVLVSSLPDLGLTPEAFLLGETAASADASLRFNALMPTLLSTGAALGLHMSFLDMNGVMTMIRNDALFNSGGVYGITDISHPCAGFDYSAGNACSASLYADVLHPSARTHEIIAMAALQAVGAVPEPETVLMMALGLGFLGYSVRRRSNSNSNSSNMV